MLSTLTAFTLVCSAQLPSVHPHPYALSILLPADTNSDSSSRASDSTGFDDWSLHREQWIYVQVPRFGLVPLQDVVEPGSPANVAWLTVGAPTSLYQPIPMHAPVPNTNNGAILVLMLPERCLGDFNMDGRVDLYDAGLFAAAYAAMDLSADLTGDLRINVHDQVLFLLLATMPCVNAW